MEKRGHSGQSKGRQGKGGEGKGEEKGGNDKKTVLLVTESHDS
jgi:hypothetical protein